MFRDSIRDAGTILLNRRGRPLTTQGVRQIISRHIQAAAIQGHITPHMFRHSYAVAAIEGRDDIKQGNLGHATAAFTLNIYAHTTQKMRQQSADRMERFIQSVSGAK